jgi:hypothetical protein
MGYELRTDISFGNDLDMGSNKITSLATPTADDDASTKEYVDGLISTLTTTVSNLAIVVQTIIDNCCP